MRIRATDQIGGHPALEVRRLLRRLSSGGATPESVRNAMELESDDEARRLIADLEHLGFVERHELKSVVGGDIHEVWYRTLKGSALAKAPASAPIHRRTARRELEAFLGRVTASRQFDFAYLVAE